MSKVKLSDQNIADLINKLVQVGKLCDIVLTTDHSYITHSQIHLELLSLISSKQLVSIQDLQSAIGVPKDIILKVLGKIEEIHLIAHKDVVVSYQFVKGLVEEIRKQIKEKGEVHLQQEVAYKYGLPLKFVLEQCKEVVEECILSNDILTSKAHEANLAAQHLDTLSSLSEPTALDSILPGVSQDKVLSLIKDHNLGRIYLGKLFLPQIYLENQKSLIKQQFNEIGFVAIKEFEKLYQKGAMQMMELQGEEIGKYVYSNHFVTKTLDLTKDRDFFPLSELEDFPIEEAQFFFQDSVIIEGFVVKNHFIQKCQEIFVEPQEKRAAEKIKNGQKPQMATVEMVEENVNKKKKGKKQVKKVEIQVEEEYQPFEIQEILTAFVDTPTLLEPLSEFLQGPLNDQFNQIFNEAFIRFQNSGKLSQSQNHEEMLEDGMLKLLLVKKTLENQVKKHSNQHEEITKLVSEVLTQDGGACDTLLTNLVHVQADHSNVNLETMNLTEIKSQADRDLVCQKFQKHVREIFTDLYDFKKDRDFLMFMDCLQDNIKNLGAHIRSQLDKKSEKTLIASLKNENGESLQSALANVLMQECNNAYFGLPDKKSMVKIYLQFLVETDYIEKESEISAVLEELAIVKKVSKNYSQIKMDEIRQKVEGKKDDLAESWCLVDEPGQEEKKVDFDEYFVKKLRS